MSARPFADPTVRMRIVVDVARIQARWLEENAVNTLVEPWMYMQGLT
jgi:hypothetical protein